uniref:Uncharacterized protein n=1 Tax=Theileria lestoquardi TaxID=77054 RepID=Q2VA73_THELE|nr:unknown [Theileria lestoquardi]
MWKKLGYIFCLSSGFNFVLFQPLLVHLKFGKLNVELEPERVPAASKACLAVGIIHLLIVVLSLLYLNGVIKFNPIHYFMRVLNMAGRHGPATGQNRYRMFTEYHFESQIPASPSDDHNSNVEQDNTSPLLDNSVSSRRVDGPQTKIPIPPYVNVSRTHSSTSVVNLPEPTHSVDSMAVNRSTDDNIKKKPSIELIDLN